CLTFFISILTHPVPFSSFFSLFFFTATPTPEIYTLSLHDALPIWICVGRSGARATRTTIAGSCGRCVHRRVRGPAPSSVCDGRRDRKSTRLNSSHSQISYAVFCLKKKKKKKRIIRKPYITIPWQDE